MLKKFKDKKGTALLIALLVMGVFMAISLTLSALVLREVRITRSFLDAGQAYYSAESGIEIGLYALNSELPGWEPDYDEDNFKSFKIDESLSTVGEFSLRNRCRAYPCFPEEEYDLNELKDLQQPRYFYDVLELNESLTIPLFVADSGSVKDVKDFTVEFFTPLNPKVHLKFKDNQNLSDWDVLRWKLIGIRSDAAGSGQTETISDFTAVSLLKTVGESDPEKIIASNATVPSWFGSVDCDELKNRYYDKIECLPYEGSLNELKVSLQDKGKIAPLIAGKCSELQAREFYLYEYFGQEKKVSEIKGCYNIKDFLENHTLNYLVLTNLVNPGALDENFYSQKEQLSRLFFRVELGAGVLADGDSAEDIGETVRPVADITAHGYSGDSKQSINVKIKRGSFMPVFNFSLYSTYISGQQEDGETHDYDYWYGSDEDF